MPVAKLPSSLSQAPEHSGSLASVLPSPSLSLPSVHWDGFTRHDDGVAAPPASALVPGCPCRWARAAHAAGARAAHAHPAVTGTAPAHPAVAGPLPLLPGPPVVPASGPVVGVRAGFTGPPPGPAGPLTPPTPLPLEPQAATPSGGQHQDDTEGKPGGHGGTSYRGGCIRNYDRQQGRMRRTCAWVPLNGALAPLPRGSYANPHCGWMKPAAAVWIGAIAVPLALLSCGGSDETAIRVVASYNQSRGFDQFVFALATAGKTPDFRGARNSRRCPAPPCPARRAWCSSSRTSWPTR